MSNADEVARGFGLIQPQKLTEGITRGEMADLLQTAADEARALVQYNLSKPGIGAQTRAAQLSAGIEGIGNLSESMWNEIGQQTADGIRSSALLAANAQMDRDFLMGMPTSAIVQYAPHMEFSAIQSAQDIISRRTNGFTLADRIYKNGRLGVIEAGKQVEAGLILQQSAREIADRVRQLYVPTVPGGQSYAAMRLARTEINNAHHDTTKSLASKLPWVEGFRWVLSGSHPKLDECDDLASDDSADMGPGVYKKDDAPDKPHPHCLCFLEVMQPDEDQFVENLMNGSYDGTLSSMGVDY